MNPEAKLAELGLTLPNPPAAAGSYVPTVRTGNLLFCAGTICLVNGQMTHTGQVGREQTQCHTAVWRVTCSTRRAAVSKIPRALHEGQTRAACT